MPSIETLFVRVNTSTHTVRDVDTTRTSVLGLKTIIEGLTGIPAREQTLMAGTKPMRDDKKLEIYNLHNEQTLSLAVRLLGGAEGVPSATESGPMDNLSAGQDVRFAVATKERCMHYDDDPATWRFKLNGCGHVMCSDGIKDKIKATANSYGTVIFCPMTGCSSQIDYNDCSHYAGMISEEMKTYEEKLATAVVRTSPNMGECPHCGMFIMKEIPDTKITCPICRGAPYCWLCLRTWKSAGTSICGNEDCGGPLAWKINALENCATKKISTCENVPEMRMCPQCEMLIVHDQNCKHMNCRRERGGCGHSFCFSCLGSSNCPLGVTCTVAPIQTPTQNR